MKQHKLSAFALSIISVLVCQSVFAECKPADNFKTITPNLLTISTNIVPPFSFKDSSGEYSGLDSAVLKRFAERNCLALNVIYTDSAAAIQYVIAGRSDISAGGWYRTAERAKVLGVSDPLYNEPAAIYSKEGYDSFSQLEGKRVGTVLGYTWVPDLKSVYGGNLMLYPNAVSLTQDLSKGRIDAAINSLAVGIAAQKEGAFPDSYKVVIAKPDQRVRTSVNPTQTGVLYTKSNVELGKALNQTIQEMKADKSIEKALEANSIPVAAADTGSPRYADQ